MIIITSTPNGFNKFYDVYDGADKGINGFTESSKKIEGFFSRKAI